MTRSNSKQKACLEVQCRFPFVVCSLSKKNFCSDTPRVGDDYAALELVYAHVLIVTVLIRARTRNNRRQATWPYVRCLSLSRTCDCPARNWICAAPLLDSMTDVNVIADGFHKPITRTQGGETVKFYLLSNSPNYMTGNAGETARGTRKVRKLINSIARIAAAAITGVFWRADLEM